MVLGVAGRQCAAAPGAVSDVGAKSDADCAQTSLRQRFRRADSDGQAGVTVANCYEGENATIQSSVDYLNS